MQPGRPTPERIFDTINGFQRTEALKAAIELSLFTAIAEGVTSPPDIADRVGASERGVRILCDYLVVLGLLQKKKGSYELAPDAAVFLDERSPAYLGTAVRFLTAPQVEEGFKALTQAVRQGRTALAGQGSMEPNHPVWVEFARGMAPLMRPAAEFLSELLVPDETAEAGPWKVLDVAAGHGLFGIHVARRHPRARIVALDWPAVLDVAQDNAASAGVADRYELLPGSAFDVDFGGGYDLVLFTNFFHHFDPPTCTRLMQKAHRALKDGGRVATLEFVPNADRVTPPQPAAFSLTMLTNTLAGDAYTFAEYRDMFRAAGFDKSETHHPSGMPQTVILSHKGSAPLVKSR